MPQPPYLGLDVARDHLDVAAHPTRDAWRVPNTPAGHAAVVRRARCSTRGRLADLGASRVTGAGGGNDH